MQTNTLATALCSALVLCALALLAAQPAAAGSMLLATTGHGASGPSTLLEIDPASGATLQTIGPVGYFVNGMEFDPSTGTLYGSTSVRDPNYNGLIVIDMTTGAGTPVAAFDGWGLTGGRNAVTNITIDGSGQMYGWWDPAQDDLVSIDKATGIATRVGESFVGTAANGLDFDLSGTLYMIQFEGVYQVNVTTGLASFIGSYGSTGALAHHGDFDPATDLYYAIGPDPWNTPKYLEVVDVSSLASLGTVPVTADIHVLTFAADPDSDGDGVPNDLDVCSDTVIPEGVPTRRLGTNRWALVDGDGIFDTTPPNGRGPERSYTIDDTGGCSCEQIIAALGLGRGHVKYGCSIGAMDNWVALVNP